MLIPVLSVEWSLNVDKSVDRIGGLDEVNI